MLHEFLEHLRTEQLYRALWDGVMQDIRANLAGNAPAIRDTVADALITLGCAVAADQAMQGKIATWLRTAVETLVARRSLSGMPRCSVVPRKVHSAGGDALALRSRPRRHKRRGPCFALRGRATTFVARLAS